MLAEDLRLCKVRPTDEAIERRFLFEVISPTKLVPLGQTNGGTWPVGSVENISV